MAYKRAGVATSSKYFSSIKLSTNESTISTLPTKCSTLSICSDLIVWIKTNNSNIIRLAGLGSGLWFKQYDGGTMLSINCPVTLPHVGRGQGEDHRQEGGEEGGERRCGERGDAHH